MTGWRPEGWDKVLYHLVSKEIYTDYEVKLGRYFVEVGADAMLETLRKSGGHCTKKTDLICDECPSEDYGEFTIVFIPDDT